MTSWNSSIITHLTFFKWERILLLTSKYASVSGVVISMCGGLSAIILLLLCGVSPCRTATSIPMLVHIALNLFIRSLFNALSGVMYTTAILSKYPVLNILDITGSRAASVLPLPVGATINVWRPESTLGIAFS